MSSKEDLIRAHNQYITEEIKTNLTAVAPTLFTIGAYMMRADARVCLVGLLFGLLSTASGFFVTFRKPPIDWVSLRESDLSDFQIKTSIDLYLKHADRIAEKFWFVQTISRAGVTFSLLTWVLV